jgi:hypothetical protein
LMNPKASCLSREDVAARRIQAQADESHKMAVTGVRAII